MRVFRGKMLFRNVSDALWAVRREKKNQRLDQSRLPEFIKKDVSPPSAPRTWQLLSSKPRNREYKQVYKLKANFLKINSGGFHTPRGAFPPSLGSNSNQAAPFVLLFSNFLPRFHGNPPADKPGMEQEAKLSEGCEKGRESKGRIWLGRSQMPTFVPPQRRG